MTNIKKITIAGLFGLSLGLAGCSATAVKEGAQPWMSKDVEAAWNNGYKGKGATITVVDEYVGDRFAGNLDGVTKFQTHGDWTSEQAGLVAPEANVVQIDYYDNAYSSYSLAGGLNVISNSYGIVTSPGYDLNDLDPLEKTTVSHAHNGTAVVVKAAGNESTAVDGIDYYSGTVDSFNLALVGAESNIYVGALSKNGSPANKADLAYYSNYAGSDPDIQNQFLVVGVDADITGLEGTSFAAPIVSGYAAILGSKFTTAQPNQIAKQLLDTARTDTINGYNPYLHGQGEASLSRALAPSSLK